MDLTVDEVLALKKASNARGFVPSGTSAFHIAYSLEARGWLRKSPSKDTWFVTDDGRNALTSAIGGTKN